MYIEYTFMKSDTYKTIFWREKKYQEKSGISRISEGKPFGRGGLGVFAFYDIPSRRFAPELILNKNKINCKNILI